MSDSERGETPPLETLHETQQWTEDEAQEEEEFSVHSQRSNGSRESATKDNLSQDLQDILLEFEKKHTNRIVFMTTMSRTFFPADPGRSRFAIEYVMNCAATDIPNPQYMPPDLHGLPLPRYVSNKGYGIGGLSAARFLKDANENNPAPNAYQNWVAVPAYKKKKVKEPHEATPSKKSLAVPVHEHGGRHSDDVHPLPPDPFEAKQKRRMLHNQCMQTVVGFGSHLSVQRSSGYPSLSKVVGVGYYNVNKPDNEIKKMETFFSSPVAIHPPTGTRCQYMGYDACAECEVVLKTVDYYRTTHRIDNPYFKVAPHERAKSQEFEKFLIMGEDNSSSNMMNKKNVFVSLCRRCYCKAVKGESKFWNPSDVPLIFRKTRHCQYVHDHQNIPIFTHKTDCKILRRLRRKEILMSKYYPDSCEKVYKSYVQ